MTVVAVVLAVMVMKMVSQLLENVYSTHLKCCFYFSLWVIPGT